MVSDFYKNFMVGTMAACTATSCIQPIDMVKVRIQLMSEQGGSTSPFKVAGDIMKEGGIKHFYKGLDSALLRQVVYGTMRLGLFYNISESMREKNGGKNLSAGQKATASIIAGGIGSFVGNPADLCLVRMQADSTLPPDQRRNYTGVGNALTRIVSEEGVTGLWAGAVPTITRAISLNVAMMVSYETAKEQMSEKMGKPASAWDVQIYASMLSAVCTAVGSLPFDNMKTKIQKQKPLADGTLPYKNMADCFAKSVAREGVTGLWAGLPTYYFRVGPHAIITLLSLEVYKKMLGVGQKK
jgi:solute carrier family 25 oxoglutarate transporter 11